MSADNITICPQCKAEHFAEYWEIGFYGDEFFVGYLGTCRKCSYGFEYTHSQPVLLAASVRKADA